MNNSCYGITPILSAINILVANGKVLNYIIVFIIAVVN